MQTPRFPYPGQYFITQEFFDNANNYNGGKHGGLDIVPLNEHGDMWIMPVYPVLSGRTAHVANTDRDRGKGIKVRTELWNDLIVYLQGKGLFPLDKNSGWIDFLYWHLLDVTDLDKTITQDTPVGITGNTGWVFSGGVEVPSQEKGVPPYRGLHLHLECVVGTGTKTLNKDKDIKGRIDPRIILNYKLEPMSNVKLIKMGGEYAFYIPAINGNALISQALNYGIQIPTKVDGSVDFAQLESMLVGEVIPK